jgi:hypothetical protein
VRHTKWCGAADDVDHWSGTSDDWSPPRSHLPLLDRHHPPALIRRGPALPPPARHRSVSKLSEQKCLEGRLNRMAGKGQLIVMPHHMTWYDIQSRIWHGTVKTMSMIRSRANHDEAVKTMRTVPREP